MKKLSTKEEFAKAYLDIYKTAVKQYKAIPWYKFKDRNNLNKRMRWSQYHYKKLTGKQVTL